MIRKITLIGSGNVAHNLGNAFVLNGFEVVEVYSRTKSNAKHLANKIKSKFTDNLKEINQERVINYLKLVETYYKNPEIVTSAEFYEKVEKSFNWIDREKEDIFMMSFFAWLKAKMTKQDVYLVTLDLINS